MSLYTAHTQQGLLLNANENANGPRDEVLEEFYAAVKEGALNRYPEDSASQLKERYASLYNLDPAGILVGNGSDMTLQIMINTLCRDGKKLVTLDPDFGMYHFYTAAMQSEVLPFATAWNGDFDLDAFIETIKTSNTGLVLFSNPNNPTGHMLSRDEILRLAKAIDPIVLAVDEAYMDFSDQSILDVVQDLDNVIVTRTLSKSWGLAGIRVGFLITNPKITNKLAEWKVVYSVSTLDQLAALAGLNHPENNQDYIELVRNEAKRIEKRLTQIEGLEHGPLHANFYALTTGDPEQNQKIEEALAARNIAVRTWPDHSRIRITIALPEHNDQVLEILETVIPELESSGS